MIATYEDLKTAVATWLARTELTDYIPDLISFAESRIAREFRIRQMEATFTDTILSGYLSLPTRYLELKHAYIATNPIQWLERKTAECIYNDYPVRTSTGIPRLIATEANLFIFGPYPDSNYTVTGTYYASPIAMSVNSDTTALLVMHPSVYLFAALAESEAFDKNDERIELWERKYEAEKKRILDADKAEKFSGSTLAMARY